MPKTNNEISEIADAVVTKYVPRGGAHKAFAAIMLGENIKFREVSAGSNQFVGALTKGLNGQVYVMVNSGIDHAGRRNFTIAHELGHYYLAHQLTQNAFYCQDKEVIEEGTGKNPIEQEANYFASCLLMPEQKVKPAFLSLLANSKKAKNKDLLTVTTDTYSIWKPISDELTKRYGVSEAALRYRLQKLEVAKFEF